MVCSPTCLPTLSQIAAPIAARRSTIVLAGALAIASLASPATAAREPSARLIECGEQSCLVVTGHRNDVAATVSINGRAVAVEGEHRWRARLPVETLRQWSAPFARTIEVSWDGNESTASVELPIGLLGHVTELATLEIRVR